MFVGILSIDRDRNYCTERICEALAEEGDDFIVFHPEDVMFHFSNNNCGTAIYNGKHLEQILDICLVRRTRTAVNASVEIISFLTSMDIPCVEGLEAFENPLSKTGTIMKAHGNILVPETIILNHTEQLKLLTLNHFPYVVKPLEGHKGIGVKLIHSAQELNHHAEYLIDQSYRLMVQEYLSIKNEYRVTVIGQEVICVCRKEKAINDSDIAKNYSQHASFTLVDNPELHSLAIAAAKRNHCLICGVDLAETNNGIYLLEANRSPEFEGVEKCGVNVAQRITEFLKKTIQSNRVQESNDE